MSRNKLIAFCSLLLLALKPLARRRFLLIAICSIALASNSLAQVFTWQWSLNGSGGVTNGIRLIRLTGGTFSAGGVVLRGTNSTAITWSTSSSTPDKVVNIFGSGIVPGVYTWRQTSGNNGSMGTIPDFEVNWNGTNFSLVDVLQTNSFNWSFPPEWGGVNVQVRSGTNLLGSWMVASNGGTLSASVVALASVMTNAQVFLDGIPAAHWAQAQTNASFATQYTDRPGYALGFDSTYSGKGWEVRRTNGTVAASGTSLGSLNQIAQGRVTLAESEGASVWLYEPPTLEVPGGWYNSGVIISGNSVTTYNFVQPTPRPNPSPTPGLFTNTIITTNVVNGNTNVTTDPQINVTNTISSGSLDDSDKNAMSQLNTHLLKLERGMQNLTDAQVTIEGAISQMGNVALTTPGKVCTFQLGSMSLDFGFMSEGAPRTAMKLLILLVAFQNAWAILRWLLS